MRKNFGSNLERRSGKKSGGTCGAIPSKIPVGNVEKTTDNLLKTFRVKHLGRSRIKRLRKFVILAVMNSRKYRNIPGKLLGEILVTFLILYKNRNQNK